MKHLLLKVFFLSLFIFFGVGFSVLAAPIPAVNITVGNKVETVLADEISRWFDIVISQIFDPNCRSEIENDSYYPASYYFCNFTMSRAQKVHVRTIFTTSTNEATIKAYLQALALKTDIDPQDAVFKGDENDNIVLAIPEVNGENLNHEKSLEILKEALEASNATVISVSLPTVTAEPDIKSNDAERLGLKELIGSGSTNFRGSPKNRVYNINRSLEQFQSLIIGPGEEFSFVEYLGEVDEEHGYLPELVIKDNKTAPEFGGGVCQVSTTLFRAAIYSGMKITERRNHSYPVPYYLPYGLDATIYIPKPDLKFMNNTAHSIMMQSVVEGTKLTFRFFGTKDGRRVSVDGPHILERNLDGSMKTVFTQIVRDTSGTEMIKDSFPSNYKSPSLFPKPGEEKKLMSKPRDWSSRQWRNYKELNP